ncbi:hypothetical protein [Nocardiopsis sp. FIRDI 009]|nr:hypothetical protein [Nocardiopsis sp. FIRDI 009]
MDDSDDTPKAPPPPDSDADYQRVRAVRLGIGTDLPALGGVTGSYPDD